MNDFASTRPVHVVVLAAGRGSRLNALGDTRPKWLLEVGGRTLADRHLEGIALAEEAVASVRVVTGHAAGGIEAELAERDGGAVACFNPEWSTLNNWYSLLLALRELEPGAPVAVVNSDLLLDPEDLAAFLVDAARTPASALLAVDFERELTDESMKVEQTPEGTLSRIGKVGIDDGVGEYPGLLMARDGVVDALRAALEAFVGRPASANQWYEGAVGRTAAEGQPWTLWAMPDSAWVEIDDDADLDRAQTLAATA